MTRSSWLYVLFSISMMTALARAEAPADRLLHLAPADADAVLIVENLRDHVATIAPSRLVHDLMALPSVQKWLESDQKADFDRSRRAITQALALPSFDVIWKDLLGDAVVLVLKADAATGFEQPRGLIMTKVRDRDLLNRLINRVNELESGSGALTTVRDVATQSGTYHVRVFREGGKPDESYTIVDGDIFLWSNSEALVRFALERHASAANSKEALGSLPSFAAARAAMPKDALAFLYISPSLLRTSAAILEKNGPASDPLLALAWRNLGAVQAVAFALEWRDGIRLHLHEILDPSQLDVPAAKRTPDTEPSGGDLARLVPTTAPVVVALNGDWSAVTNWLVQKLRSGRNERLEAGLIVLRGLLLDHDPLEDILPHVGPDAVAYIDLDKPKDGPVVVAGVALSGPPERVKVVRAAIDNATRTLFALMMLDTKENTRGQSVQTRDLEGTTVRTIQLAGSRSVSIAINDRLLAVGSNADAVARFVTGSPAAQARFEELMHGPLTGYKNFAVADLDVLGAWASAHRDGLVQRMAQRRTEAEARHDLDQTLVLIKLFRAAYVGFTVDDKATSAHQVIGLVAQPQPEK